MAANSHPLSLIWLWVGELTGARCVVDLQWGQSCIYSQLVGQLKGSHGSRWTSWLLAGVRMGVLSSSRLAGACSQGSGQRAKLSRPCEACHFASFCWPSQVTRPTQKLQKYAVPLNGKCCNVVWQRGQLQARAGESWPPTIYSTMNYSTPGFSVLHYLLEFAQTHVH